MTTSKIDVSSGAIVFRKDMNPARVLLVRVEQGGWTFPKGHKIGKESEQETALRSILDKTGARISVQEGFREKFVYSPVSDKEREIVYLLASYEGGMKEEEPDCIWASVIMAEALLAYQQDKDLLYKVVKYIEVNDPESDAWLLR